MNAHITLLSPIEVLSHCCSNTPYTILDARPSSDYLAGHLPGALWVGWEDWCETAPTHAGQTGAQAGYWGVLKQSQIRAREEALSHLGLSNERPVLVYADGPISKGREGRIAWMLLYWGICSVFLLDGGWSAWLGAGGSSEVSIAQPASDQFRIQVQAHRLVQFPQLKQNFQSNALPLLIDVRSLSEFDGHDYSYQPRMGRLPGAVHMPFSELFDASGYFIPKSVYLQRLPPQIMNADCCVAYCEVGVRSSLFALLHEAYTGQVVANFDGSVMQWALDWTLPMESDAQ